MLCLVSRTAMYLADRDIRALLDELEIHTPDPGHAFDADRQIQPCSIDVRLSPIFWESSRRRRLWRQLLPTRDRTIDLRRSDLHDVAPLRDWRKLQLGERETLVIKPGHTIMGRIYERFRIPPGYAGKIEGRSSYARLGLSVHCTGDFINPGWAGFMPLQLTNSGPYPVRIAPYFSVCQLMLIKLSSTPERSYGDPDLNSKYANDDGGPSLWWRDGRVKELQSRLATVSLTEGIRREIVETARSENPEVLERMERYIDRMRVESVENAAQVFDGFASKELWLRRRDVASLYIAGLLIAGLVSALFVDLSLTLWHVVLIAVTAVVGIRALVGWFRREAGYLDPKALSIVRPDTQAR